MHYKSVEIGRAVNIRRPSATRKAKTVWEREEASANGDEYYDQDNVRQIENCAAVR